MPRQLFGSDPSEEEIKEKRVGSWFIYLTLEKDRAVKEVVDLD